MDTCRSWSHTIHDLHSLRQVDDDDHEWEASKEASTVPRLINSIKSGSLINTHPIVAAMTR
jgi:hypothetical protein